MISIPQKIQKKEKIQIAVTAALVLVLAFLLLNAPKKRNAVSGAASGGQIQTLAEFANHPPEASSYSGWEQEAKKLEVKRDPFFPVLEESDSGFYLNGIVWDEEKPTVIINNAIFAAGDSVNGFTVVAIERSRVLLNDGKNDLELKLEEKK